MVLCRELNFNVNLSSVPSLTSPFASNNRLIVFSFAFVVKLLTNNVLFPSSFNHQFNLDCLVTLAVTTYHIDYKTDNGAKGAKRAVFPHPGAVLSLLVDSGA